MKDPACTCSNPTPYFVSELFWKFNMLYFFVSCLFLCVLFFFVSRLCQKLKPAEEKSMLDNNNAPQMKYDVFVSFRGKDIRRRFLSHLTDSFQRSKINAFVDDKDLEKGEEIWPSLVGGIEGSSISLIIFSPEYAFSRWCLEELVTILKCREKYGQIVIPVFYDVEPTDVRYQSSESYKMAFVKHGRKYKTKVQTWRNALNKAADLSGIESSKFHNDAELLKAIVDLVLMTLGRPLINLKGLVGIEERIAVVESLIRKKQKDTRLIGIWGMGGMGKTILAEIVFNKLWSEYEGRCFLANEREQSSKYGIISLKKEIFSQLLGTVVKIDTPNSLPNDRIHRMKVLIILDDVNDSDHIEKLLGTLDNFGSGSRIIVTTRDKQVLIANNVDEIYQLREFSSDKALELFNLNAFNQSDHQRVYDELSKRIVHYANGIPLVLKVLACRLRGKNKDVWESELYKLKKIPPTKVYNVMKLSYDDLDRKEEQFFLDLACFFLRSRVKVNVDHLKSLLKDGEHNNSVISCLERLKDKALITFSEDNLISMHDSLQEMGWEIVRREFEDHGSCSWLWDPNDICEALKNEKGTEAIRSILITDLPTIKQQKLNPQIFANMRRLQFLEISVLYDYGCFDQHNILAEGLQFLATKLRFLCWDYYPLKSLPENFLTEQLVILKLLSGGMEKLWHGVKNLVNLKELNLTDSKKLKELPDLSKATNLEELVLRRCSMLTNVHPSIFCLPKLEKLDLGECWSLTILASYSHLCSLSYLNLDLCENLREFSLISKNMKELRLRNTKVKELPSSFGHQSKLKLLHLTGSDIERLPSSINNLEQLQRLEVSCCRKFQTIAELPLFLETLDVNSCTSLKTLPKLPLSLKTLDAKHCRSLKTVLFPTIVEQLKESRKRVLFWNCENLDEHSLEAIGLNAQINVMKFANQHLSTPNHDHVENYNDYDYNHHSYQAVYGYPGWSVPKWLEYKTTKDYVIIDLPCAPPSPLFGFIFCFVLDNITVTKTIQRLEVIITTSDVEGEGKKDSAIMYLDYWNRKIYARQVCVMYDKRCSDFLNSGVKNKKRFKVEATIGARILFTKTYYELPQKVLRRFGVSPISTLSYNNFIQQMELRDSMSQFH